jgi:glycogen debranching enzyme
MQPRLQPFLSDQIVSLRAPTQLWSDRTGDVGGSGILGLYHGDVRVLDGLSLRSDGALPEWISVATRGASVVTFTGVLRHLDDESADPRIRIERTHEVTSNALEERIVILSALGVALDTSVTVELRPDFSSMQSVKAGAPAPSAWTADPLDLGVQWSHASTTARLQAPDAALRLTDTGAVATWCLTIPPHGITEFGWRIELADTSAVVAAATGELLWRDLELHTDDSRLARWVTTALADLDALRMTSSLSPGDEFFAAGAPWFFTLFGRDALWSARFLLPISTAPALSTLRVLAAAQGTKIDPQTAEQPGKIMHELRATELNLLGTEITLPPRYYGTIDATPLWICLLYDAWQWGATESDIRALLPALEAALAWMRDYGDSDGDGFLEYIDSTGHGLANQGWKDSGDSIQWRDGRLADGPIALCEVQAYAYEAAVHGAELLEGFGRPGAEEWRTWAARVKRRFAEAFWVDDPQGGRYPAVALDAGKRRVDTLTSNIGHLVGTGILDPHEEHEVADRLASPRLDSGFGLRTMSTDSAGYWPLSYHGGSVWAHDTAITVMGLGRAGLAEHAAGLIEGLLRAAERFEFRMPELHSGDAARETSTPAPYPAACRPQAWSAAASIAVLAAKLGLRPAADALVANPIRTTRVLTIDGLRVGDRRFSVCVRDDVVDVRAAP